MAKNFKFREVSGSGVIILDLFSTETGLFYQQFDQIQNWVIASMLNATDLLRRIEIITRFVEMAETSRQLGNYFAMAAIITGLNSPAVKLFRKAWTIYPSKAHIILLQDMTKLLQRVPNGPPFQQEYMKRVKTQQTTAVVLNVVPYLDALTQTNMEPDNIPNTNMVNFDKRRRIASALNELALHQKKPYEYADILPVQRFLMSLPAQLDSDHEINAFAIAVRSSVSQLVALSLFKKTPFHFPGKRN